MDTHDGLPPQFHAAVERWRQAEQDVRVGLQRYRATPNAVNRLALGAAWAAIKAELDELGEWGALFRGSRAAQASEDALASWGRLQAEIYGASLLGRPGGG
jgi:hypothetical protein